MQKFRVRVVTKGEERGGDLDDRKDFPETVTNGEIDIIQMLLSLLKKRNPLIASLGAGGKCIRRAGRESRFRPCCCFRQSRGAV